MNDRRKIVIALCAGAGALALPLRAFAQQQGKLWRIGLLGMTSIEGFPRQVEALRAGLRELVTSKEKTWSSSSAGRRASTTGSQRSRPNWSVSTSISS